MLQDLLARLEGLLNNAFWRIRAFRNQSDFDHELIPDGVDSVAIRFEARVQFINRHGDVATEWRRNGAGERVGERPLLLQPDGFLDLKSTGEVVVRPRVEISHGQDADKTEVQVEV
ncbi:MAG: hypothetical protein HZA94_01350 [Candidatus Vogelbacteria bacterium]|nr:hypothetical protein [Candidatus Vogelbacteria bacterium]